MLRIALLAISAVTTGYVAGRRAISNEVEKKKLQTIEEAAETARHDILEHGHSYIAATLREYVIVTAIKAALLALFFILWRTGLMPGPVFSTAIAILLAAFLIRDAIVAWPMAKLVIIELRKYGWNPKRTFGEIVAARVFEQVYLEANTKLSEAKWRDRVMMSVAGEKNDELSVEIAGAVAHIAQESSWSDLRPFVIAAGLRWAGLAVLYSVFVFLLIAAI